MKKKGKRAVDLNGQQPRMNESVDNNETQPLSPTETAVNRDTETPAAPTMNPTTIAMKLAEIAAMESIPAMAAAASPTSEQLTSDPTQSNSTESASEEVRGNSVEQMSRIASISQELKILPRKHLICRFLLKLHHSEQGMKRMCRLI